MDEFSATLKTVQNIFLFFLSFCLAAWAFFVDYRVYIAGIMLGSLASMVNARFLAYKINKMAAAAIEQKGRKVTLGFLTRAAIAGFAGLVAVRYPEQVALTTTIVGYFFAQLATLVLGIVSNRKSK